jgi:HEAT repeat protein
MSHVFISFHRSERLFVDQVIDRIENVAHLPTWVYTNRLRAGMFWKPEIDDALQECMAVVVIMTPDAQNSEYIAYEWTYAMGLGKPIIPMLLEPTLLHPKLEALEPIDFTNEPLKWGDFMTRLEAAIAGEEEEEPEVELVIPSEARQAIDDLADPDPDVRKAAIQTLAHMQEEAVQTALFAALSHPKRSVRAYSALLLAREPQFRDERIVWGLLEALYEGNPSWARGRAASLLRDMGDVAVPALAEVLADGQHQRLHETVVALLEQIGTPRALSLLREWQTEDEA